MNCGYSHSGKREAARELWRKSKDAACSSGTAVHSIAYTHSQAARCCSTLRRQRRATTSTLCATCFVQAAAASRVAFLCIGWMCRHVTIITCCMLRAKSWGTCGGSSGGGEHGLDNARGVREQRDAQVDGNGARRGGEGAPMGT